MPKKTKRQKKRADSARTTITRGQMSHGTPHMQPQTAPTPTSLFSFTRSSNPATETSYHKHIDQNELIAIRKDLYKTVLLAGAILTAELLLAYYLR